MSVIKYGIGFHHEKIRCARKALQLEASEVAKHIGITNAGYRDVEAYPEEVFYNISFLIVCKLMKMLKLRQYDLFNFLEFSKVNKSRVSMAELVGNGIRHFDGSMEELSDLLNIEECEIINSWHQPLFFSALTLSDFVTISSVLKVSIEELVVKGYGELEEAGLLN